MLHSRCIPLGFTRLALVFKFLLYCLCAWSQHTDHRFGSPFTTLQSTIMQRKICSNSLALANFSATISSTLNEDKSLVPFNVPSYTTSRQTSEHHSKEALYYRNAKKEPAMCKFIFHALARYVQTQPNELVHRCVESQCAISTFSRLGGVPSG